MGALEVIQSDSLANVSCCTENTAVLHGGSMRIATIMASIQRGKARTKSQLRRVSHEKHRVFLGRASCSLFAQEEVPHPGRHEARSSDSCTAWRACDGGCNRCKATTASCRTRAQRGGQHCVTWAWGHTRRDVKARDR